MLIRAGALHHDIGKLAIPIFFIENQNTGFNPHNEISYQESAQAIISHVTNGVKLAYKHKLPEPIIDFIRTHHGTSKTKYFTIAMLQKTQTNRLIQQYLPTKDLDHSHEKQLLL